ncbi:hypothetical protein, partial [[Clostridium] symbiosum]|uniref:hypothetical protein n=1 Tax=Clostridium symbiosum TaxID=1512 RepID=UPI002ED1BC9C
ADTPGGVFRSGENLPGEGDTADIFRLRPAKTKPQYLLLQPAMPNPRDERLIYTPHHTGRVLTHFTFNKKEPREQDSLLLTNYIFHIGSSSAKP